MAGCGRTAGWSLIDVARMPWLVVVGSASRTGLPEMGLLLVLSP